MRVAVLILCLMVALGARAVAAAECPGNPNALGVSRTIAIDPAEHSHLGSHQYRESLPLNDHEVVLTFDDGPLPPNTNRVLDTLAAECTKATFFIVGRMATSFPQLVRRAHEEGHTIANHSQNHPLKFHKFTVDQASKEIEDGFASIRTALGDPSMVSDFFRIPGLLRQPSVEDYLDSRKVMTWSVDFMADDWHRRIAAAEIVKRGIARIEAKGRGILLLHDIHAHTAAALPVLLQELKRRGYKIVHVVEAGPGHPKTASEPEQWVARHETANSVWPRPDFTAVLRAPILAAPSLDSFGVTYRSGAMEPATLVAAPDLLHTAAGNVLASALWVRATVITELTGVAGWPIPAAANFRYAQVFKPRPPTHPMRTPVARLDPRLTPTIGQPPALRRPPLLRGPATHHPIGHQIQLPKPTAALRPTPSTAIR